MKVRRRSGLMDAQQFLLPDHDALEKKHRPPRARNDHTPRPVNDTGALWNGQPILADEDGVHTTVVSPRGRFRVPHGHYIVTHPNGDKTVTDPEGFRSGFEVVEP